MPMKPCYKMKNKVEKTLIISDYKIHMKKTLRIIFSIKLPEKKATSFTKHEH